MKTINNNWMIGVYSTDGSLNIHSPLLGDDVLLKAKVNEEVNLDTVDGVNPNTIFLIPSNHHHTINGDVTLVHDVDTFRNKYEEMLNKFGEDTEHLLYNSFYLRLHDVMFASIMKLNIYLDNKVLK